MKRHEWLLAETPGSRLQARLGQAYLRWLSFRENPLALAGLGLVLLLVAVANGRRYGGGILVAPNASVDDGLLDVVAIDDAPPAERIALFQTAQAGKHLARPGVTVRRERSVTLRFEAPPMFQIDGEVYQARRSEVLVECVPGALRVITAPAAASPPPAGFPASRASAAAPSRSTGRL